MQALWLEDQHLSFRSDVPAPDLAPGYALIRMRLAGICSTDLELVKGYYPFTGIPGHEFVGDVIAAPGAEALVGQRVVGEINQVCGKCAACQSGNPTHCERRTTLGIRGHNGAFAEQLTLPQANLHLVPSSVPDQAAVFVEPLAAALEIQQQVQIHPTDRILVIGAGRLGQLIAMTLALTGCDLAVLARHTNQRTLLAAQGIAVITEAELSERSKDIVVEASGSQAGFALARRVVRPRGMLILKSTYHGDAQVNLSSLVVDEIHLVGSRCGPFPPALRLLENGQVNPLAMIEMEYPISRGLEAFEHAARPSVLKVLLRPG